MKIKNWDDFQHYKHGKNASKRPEWIKLYTRLLDDMEFHSLDPVDAKILVMLWMLASESDGELPSLKTIAFRLRYSEKEIQTVLGRLGHWLDGVSYDVPRTEEKRIEGEENKKENENETRAREFAETFWPLYPNKVGKPNALSAYLRARKKVSMQTILDGLETYKRQKPPDRQWLNPATFLNQERWADQPGEVSAAKPLKQALWESVCREVEKEIDAKSNVIDLPVRHRVGSPPGSGENPGQFYASASRPENYVALLEKHAGGSAPCDVEPDDGLGGWSGS